MHGLTFYTLSKWYVLFPFSFLFPLPPPPPPKLHDENAKIHRPVLKF